jgi:hypothetical protein
MRLLDTSTIKLHEFHGNAIPEYAILSHRWETEEVSFQNLRNGSAAYMTGYQKIKQCCAQAALDGCEYAWVDSCCIDKTSSAELSEAINSMFQWYRDAQVCYVYLADVSSWRDGHDFEDNHNFEASSFCQSKWFTRGWISRNSLRLPKWYSLTKIGFR